MCASTPTLAMQMTYFPEGMYDTHMLAGMVYGHAFRRGTDGPLQVSHGVNALGTPLYDAFVKAVWTFV